MQDDAMGLEEFVGNLTRQSLPQFHTPLFSLVLYNMGFKKIMLNKASMVIDKGEETANLVNGLDAADVQIAADHFHHGANAGSRTSINYLRKIKAVAGALPHTNEAAGKA